VTENRKIIIYCNF